MTALPPYQSTQLDVACVIGTLQEQHELLNSMAAEIQAVQEKNTITIDQIKKLGNLLYEHVHFEERELFPIVEQHLTEDELDAIYTASPDNIKHLDQQR